MLQEKKPTPFYGDPDFNLTDNDRGNPKPEWNSSQWKETKSSAWQQDGWNKTYHQEEQYEYKKNANWYSTSSSSVTNETCNGET